MNAQPTSLIRIVDVGAMLLGALPYEPVMRRYPCTVIGFEPLPDALRKLTALYGEERRFLPHVIGDGTRQVFHRCAKSWNSSLLWPNFELLRRFSVVDNFRVLSSTAVQTVRLDDFPEARDADYLKIDVQGGEMMVLNGAPETLRNALVVHIEVEFAPMYVGQPLFGDIDTHLRQAGFAFHSFRYLGKRPYAPMPLAAATQMLWADALYVREAVSGERLHKLAAILHEDYQADDLVSYLLAQADKAA